MNEKKSLMQDPAPNGVTQLLVNWSNGDKAALDEMLPLVYQELRRIGERPVGASRLIACDRNSPITRCSPPRWSMRHTCG